MKLDVIPVESEGTCSSCGKLLPAWYQGASHLCSVNGVILCIECADRVVENIPRKFIWWACANKTFGQIGMIMWIFSWLLMFSMVPVAVSVNMGFIWLLFPLFILNINWPLYPIETPSQRIGFARYIHKTAEVL